MTREGVDDSAYASFSHLPGLDTKVKEKIWARMLELDYLPRSEKFGGFYIVSRYDDVREMATNADVFSVASGISLPPVELGADDDLLIPLELDPPEHGKYRKLLLPFLSPARVNGHQSSIRDLVRKLIGGFKEKRSLEFVKEFCLPLPSAVTIDLLRFPVRDAERLDRLINGSLAMREGAGARDCALELSRYIDEYLSELRASPLDDENIASVLSHSEIENRRLTPREQRCILRLLIFGGFTTTTFVLAEAVRWLAENPHGVQWLYDNPDRVGPAVDEFVRYASPGTYLARTVRKEVTLRGTRLSPGDKVLMCYGAANRDSRVFDRATEVRLDRKPNPHLGFGSGVHTCVGFNFARMEIRIALQELVKEFERFQLDPAEPIRWIGGETNGMENLPLFLTPRNASPSDS